MMRKLYRTTKHGSKCPQRATMAVFGPDTFLPLAVVAKEVSKSSDLAVKGKLKKSQITPGKICSDVAPGRGRCFQ